MDINLYLSRAYGPQPCFELVADIYANEFNAIAVDYKTVKRSIREMSSAFRIALNKGGHGFSQIEAPIDYCIVLLGKTEKIGIHHCGVFYQGKVIHAMPGITLYEEMTTIRDKFELIEYWSKAV